MSPAIADTMSPTGGEIALEGLGVRFDFDHLGRVLTPGARSSARASAARPGG